MISVSPRRWLYLPIETKVREIDGKTLLALEAAERGWGVIVGRKDIETRPGLPAGMHIAKSTVPGQGAQFSAMRANGGRVSAWCEEGLVYPNAEVYVRRNFEREAFDQLDFYFAWGHSLADDLVVKLGYPAEKITVSGNPRFDLLRPELREILTERVERIRLRHGPVILINTAFTLANNFMGSDVIIDSMRRQGRVRTTQDGVALCDLAVFQGRIRDLFVPMIREVSGRYPTHRIIIRPHPSENHDFWRQAAAGLDNVAVIHEGNVAEWILAADVSIHNNCTTGVEAFILGKTSIAYRPHVDADHDLFLPHALSTTAGDLEDLVTQIDATLDGRCDRLANGEKSEIAAHHVANLTGPLAISRIMDALAHVDMPEIGLAAPISRSGVVPAAWRRLRPIRGAIAGRQRRRWQRYRDQKFGTVDQADVKGFMTAVSNCTGRFGNVKVADLGDNAFCFYC